MARSYLWVNPSASPVGKKGRWLVWRVSFSVFSKYQVLKELDKAIFRKDGDSNGLLQERESFGSRCSLRTRGLRRRLGIDSTKVSGWYSLRVLILMMLTVSNLSYGEAGRVRNRRECAKDVSQENSMMLTYEYMGQG
jgi:hypothetical protein